jgi:antitoxin component of RelBE/YafQ-DinJ toxin-antitoxin module
MLIIEKDFNVSTGIETITEREETAEEIKERLDYEKAVEAAQAEAAAKKAERQEVLKKLGLTADEAAALLGL